MRQGSHRQGGIAGLLLIGVLVSLPEARAGETAPVTRVRIGIVSSVFRDTAPSLIGVITPPLRSLMESQMGMKGELLIGGDAVSVGKALKEKRLQLAVLHSWELAWARQVCPELKPLVICVAYKEGLRADLVVRKDSPASSCSDLKGSWLSLPAISRGHLHLYLERRCPSASSEPRKFFAAIRRSSDAEDALDDVVDGKSQAALVETAAMERYRKDKPGRAGNLRVLQQSEPIPFSVIAYCGGGLDDETLKSIKEGLLQAENSQRGRDLLSMCRIIRFADVPADFDQSLADILKAYPPLDRGKAEK